MATLATFAPVALAHPMGNFSINHYAGLRAEHGELLLRYRLDLAEIATAQEMPALDADGDGSVSDAERADYLRRKVRELTARLSVTLDERPAALSVTGADLQIRPGAGDLPTLLITIDCRTPLSPGAAPAGTRVAVQYRDGTYPERDGWREISARDGPGCKILSSDVPRGERSAALTVYPADPTSAPPQEREVQLLVLLTEPTPGGAGAATQPASNSQSAGTGPTAPAATPAGTPASRNTSTPQDKFTELISAKRLSPAVVLLSLGMAFLLGTFHALSPGHGKTVVAAYLVGSRGTPRHALLLGLVVTVTHVIGVFALGLTVLAASRYVLPERLYPWLGYTSGLLIVAIGLWQFGRRYAVHWLRSRYPGGLPAALAYAPASAGHHHGPGGHTHEMPDKLTPAGLIALGVSGGILPCPSALIVMLAAIALHRVALGLVLIVAFSFGLAAVLIAIGLLMLYARRIVERFKWESGPLARLPLVSPLVVAALGVVIAVQSLKTTGLVPTTTAQRPAPASR